MIDSKNIAPASVSALRGPGHERSKEVVTVTSNLNRRLLS